jgi:hypothetical protein
MRSWCGIGLGVAGGASGGERLNAAAVEAWWRRRQSAGGGDERCVVFGLCIERSQVGERDEVLLLGWRRPPGGYVVCGFLSEAAVLHRQSIDAGRASCFTLCSQPIVHGA